MRVLFYNWEYPPIGAGIGQYIFFMSQALREQGHFSVVVTSKNETLSEVEEIHNGMIYRVINQNAMNSAEMVESVLKISKRHNIDFVEGAEHLGGCKTLLTVNKRPPVVIKMHYNDVLYRLRYAQAHYWWQYGAIWLACMKQLGRLRDERYCIEHADKVIAPCQAIIDIANKQGIQLPGNLEVVPNPTADPGKSSMEEAKSPVVVFVGRIDFGKGAHCLPGIIRYVHNALPDVKFELAGNSGYAFGIGSVENWLRKELGDLQRFITFHGFLDGNALDKLYGKAWVVIVPSSWDTFPNVVLEAMARGKSIVASANGGMTEMLSGTSNVIASNDSDVFPDAVISFIRDKKKRIAAGRSGRKRFLAEYSCRAVVEKYISALDTCQ